MVRVLFLFLILTSQIFPIEPADEPAVKIIPLVVIKQDQILNEFMLAIRDTDLYSSMDYGASIISTVSQNDGFHVLSSGGENHQWLNVIYNGSIGFISRGDAAWNPERINLYNLNPLRGTKYFEQDIIDVELLFSSDFTENSIESIKLKDSFGESFILALNSLSARSIWAGYSPKEGLPENTPFGFVNYQSGLNNSRRLVIKLTIVDNQFVLPNGELFHEFHDETQIWIHELSDGDLSFIPFQTMKPFTAADGTLLGVHPRGAYAIEASIHDIIKLALEIVQE